jgi:hypothetical protein
MMIKVDGKFGSEYYGVMTVGKRDGTTDKLSRFSRTGDDFIRTELSDAKYTYRFEMFNGGVVLLRIDKKWSDAVNTPEGKWEVLMDSTDIDAVIMGGAPVPA